MHFIEHIGIIQSGMYLMRQFRYTKHKTLNNYPKYIYGKSAYKRDDVFDFI